MLWHHSFAPEEEEEEDSSQASYSTAGPPRSPSYRWRRQPFAIHRHHRLTWLTAFNSSSSNRLLAASLLQLSPISVTLLYLSRPMGMYSRPSLPAAARSSHSRHHRTSYQYPQSTWTPAIHPEQLFPLPQVMEVSRHPPPPPPPIITSSRGSRGSQRHSQTSLRSWEMQTITASPLTLTSRPGLGQSRLALLRCLSSSSSVFSSSCHRLPPQQQPQDNTEETVSIQFLTFVRVIFCMGSFSVECTNHGLSACDNFYFALIPFIHVHVCIIISSVCL